MKKFAFITLLILCVLHTSAQTRVGQLIKVSTDKHEMIFRILENKKVSFEYWGETLKDPARLLDKKYRCYFLTKDELRPELYQSYYGNTYLDPALRIIHSDGLLTTELEYIDTEVKAIDDNVTETVVKMKDKLYPLYVDIKYKAYRKENVICQSVSVYHNENGNIWIEKIASSYVPFHANNYYLSHYDGGWSQEMQQSEEKLSQGKVCIESRRGIRNTLSSNPSFLLSINKPADEYSGEIYAGSLAWSGSYQITFEYEENKSVHMVAGMNSFASTYHLPANKAFTTPEMVLTYSNSGRSQISHNLHDWARKYSICHGDTVRDIVLNSWEGAYFDFDEKVITDMIDDAAKLGIEMFVLDDGWFGNKYPRNSDTQGLGDWQTNIRKLPRGINYLGEYANRKGIKFGIWIEPEMVNPGSELAERHPDWIVGSVKRENKTIRDQWILDMTNPDVQDFVFNTFDKVVSLSPYISYIKWDANRYVGNVNSSYLSPEEQTHFWIDYIQGLYSVYQRVREKYPDITIQQCSSGGGRVDFGALKYHDEFWTSDNITALDRVFIQYGTNIFYPAIASASHVSTSPNHITGMEVPLKFRFDVAMSGRLGMELQPKDIKGDDYVFAANAINNYKKIRPIVQLGDLYRLVSPYETNWASLMYVSKDRSQAVFFAYSLKYQGQTAWLATPMRGLDPNKTYLITELNLRDNKTTFWGDSKEFTGDYLMKEGVNLSIIRPFESTVLLLTGK